MVKSVQPKSDMALASASLSTGFRLGLSQKTASLTMTAQTRNALSKLAELSTFKSLANKGLDVLSAHSPQKLDTVKLGITIPRPTSRTRPPSLGL